MRRFIEKCKKLGEKFCFCSFDSLWQEEIFQCLRSWIIQWQDIQYDSWQFISNHTMITLWKTLILCRWTTSVCAGQSLGSRVNKLCNVLYILSTHMCVRTRTVPAYTLLWCSDLFCSMGIHELIGSRNQLIHII